ncbi:MAG TPA: sigma-70 family RNA polymerase sigma factor [Thermoanaerobaculia bacterium]
MTRCDRNCGLCLLHSRERLPDAELIDRILDGETSMFEVLLHRYCVHLLRVATAILGNDADAEDAVQQTCINAYVHLGGFERRSSLSTWLTAIAVNEARGRLRPRRSTVVEQLDDREAARMRSMAPGPEEECMASELAARLRAGVEALPSQYRVVFDLRRNQGLSTLEVADRLGLARDVVKTRLYRAKQKLRASIGAVN